MKKVTDFIVNKRYFILIFFIILSALSLYISKDVKINYDISKYLPESSETKKGMNIMNDNFDEIKQSTLNVMFKDLETSEKQSIKKKLEKIKNVDSVSYDETTDYNNGKYTLYILNVKDVSDSTVAKNVYNDVNKEFKDVSLSGSIAEANKEVLHLWIVVVAVIFALIILIIMCTSFIEPFLILFVILLAVALNKGTNIFFEDVSHITNSISAILQMALSMDYSIILLNRYAQEKKHENNKQNAMKKALYHSFGSISSSSITTIAGLLSLVFMSFTIGKDLGFVLAKGVLLSLLSIFLCLPALVILCDKLITKTHKKTFKLKLDFLGNISCKFRYAALALFIILFISGFLIKGGLNILYTDIEQDEVGKYFKENNQMAVIYNNKYDDLVSKYCLDLKNDNVNSVLCYGNTINQKLTVDELPIKLEELGSSTDIDTYLLKLLYYNYYNKDNNIKMSFNEFVSFIQNNIYSNSEFNKQITDDVKNNINKLNYFVNVNSINKDRNYNEYLSILGIEEDTSKDLFILYNSNNISTSIKLDDFINFLNNLPDKYKSSITDDQKSLISKVLPFLNKEHINKEMNAKELSVLFGLDLESVSKILLSYYLNVDIDYKVSLNELILKTVYLKQNTSYLNDANVDELLKLGPIVQNDNSVKLDKQYLSKYFENINNTLVDTVYTSFNLPDNYLFTPSEFLEITLTNLTPYLSDEDINNLSLLKFVIDNGSIEYSAGEISNLFNIDKNKVINLYNLIAYTNNYEYTLSPNKLVKTILNKGIVNDKDVISNLQLLNLVMDSINTDKAYSVSEMTDLLKTDDVKLLYSLYEIEVLHKNVTISINDFTSFLINDVVNNTKYNFNEDSVKTLKTVRMIIDSTLNNTKYNYDELYNILSNLSTLDKTLVELVYLYNGSINYYDDTYSLTAEQFVNYLYKDILNDNRFTNFINDEMKKTINKSKDDIDSAKKLLVSDNYSRMIINTTYKLEGKETFDFIETINDNLDKDDIYVIGDSPMAYDMSNSFGEELNFITILTMILIFIVVALTFKSIVTSLILVLIIQCSVFATMGILSVTKASVYFIALLIVQSILMGATIDYAIVYTSYYRELRGKNDILTSLKKAYNKSIHTILTSASILIIVTLIVGRFASAIASKICITLSEGTFCSLILILFILPGVLASLDRFIIKKK